MNRTVRIQEGRTIDVWIPTASVPCDARENEQVVTELRSIFAKATADKRKPPIKIGGTTKNTPKVRKHSVEESLWNKSDSEYDSEKQKNNFTLESNKLRALAANLAA